MTNQTSLPESEVTLEERMALIRNYPLFSKLKPHEVKELALLFKEQHVPPSTNIVNEGAPVDSVYLIVSGAAEVTRRVTNMQENKIYNVATLSKGDAIGLSQEGFFSQTGLRAGTVMSALSMTLLVISLQDFYLFLQKSELIPPGLINACENILLINFIKQTHIFSHLSLEQIQKLIAEKKKISLPKGEMLFKEGDIANKCYFVLSGKIGISSKGSHIATIESSHILGEGALIAGEKRNADAYAEEDSELFVLDRAQIKKISSTELKQEVQTRRINQLRPMPRPDVIVSEFQTPEKELMMTLHNRSNQSELQLSNTDYVIWKNLDGRTTLQSILNRHSSELNDLTIQDIYSRILDMGNAGFLDLKKETFFDKIMKKIRQAW